MARVRGLGKVFHTKRPAAAPERTRSLRVATSFTACHLDDAGVRTPPSRAAPAVLHVRVAAWNGRSHPVRHGPCSTPPVPGSTSTWLRSLRLYHALGEDASTIDGDGAEDILDVHVHARSRFRSLAEPSRFAVYSVQDAAGGALPRVPPAPRGLTEQHTLVAVREFRRVPLHASSLALLLMQAQPHRAARVVSALAAFVERVVERHEPSYLLAAHSREEPALSVLIAGAHDVAALGAGAASLSATAVLPDLRPLLVDEPDWFAYWPEPWPAPVGELVSPYAV